MPLVKVLLAAWPGAWTTANASPAAAVSDLISIPPFPRLAVRLGRALIHAGRADLAAHHLITVLQFHRQHGAPLTGSLDRLLRPAAVDALCHRGRRLEAWRVAGAGFSVPGIIRCCRWW